MHVYDIGIVFRQIITERCSFCLPLNGTGVLMVIAGATIPVPYHLVKS